MYLNGTEEASFTYTDTFTTALTSYFYIGHTAHASHNSQNYMDDFRVYNRVLSATEITDMYNEGVNNDITGVVKTYRTPQVILRYDSEVCPSDAPTFTPTGNVTFLLAKGNVTVGDITTPLQSTIKTDIATALGITEADRVFIDQIKASPRRDKEVNMVVHIEHGDTDRDSIAGKTTEVAAAVKDALNTGGLNVCGCNAASLVNQQVQTSITC